MLQLSAAGGTVGYFCLAAALGEHGSLWLLLASRVPIGLLKQTVTVGRALVTDCTTPQARAGPMSKLGAAIGAGFVLGPAFGGAISKKFGLAAPPLLAASLFVLSQIVIATALPETAPLPLSRLELRALLRRTAGLRAAAGAPAADDTSALGIDEACAACAQLLPEWKPNGAPVPYAESAAILAGWAEAVKRCAAGARSPEPSLNLP
jgi:MFS family permease